MQDELINWLTNLQLHIKSRLEDVLSGRLVLAPPLVFDSSPERRWEYERWGQQISDKYAASVSIIHSYSANLLRLLGALPQSEWGTSQYNQILMQFNYDLNKMFEERESIESAMLSLISIVGELYTAHPPKGLEGKRDLLVRGWAEQILAYCAQLRSLSALLRGDMPSCGEAIREAEARLKDATKLMGAATASTPGCLLAIFGIFFRV